MLQLADTTSIQAYDLGKMDGIMDALCLLVKLLNCFENIILFQQEKSKAGKLLFQGFVNLLKPSTSFQLTLHHGLIDALQKFCRLLRNGLIHHIQLVLNIKLKKEKPFQNTLSTHISKLKGYVTYKYVRVI